MRPLKPAVFLDGEVLITLSQGLFAIVDLIDAELATVNWCMRQGGTRTVKYAYRRPGSQVRPEWVHLHRAVLERMGADLSGRDVDHIDGDGLNNRRSNLRSATRSQNLQNKRTQSNNKSGCRGVSRKRKSGKWHACISVRGKTIHLGSFADLELASFVFEEASIKYYGEFARSSCAQQ